MHSFYLRLQCLLGANCAIAVWPGSSLHYSEIVETPRYEDFHIEYLHKNPWAHLGMGFCKSNLEEGVDLSPYLQLENIDPKWLKAIGFKGSIEELLKEEEEGTKRRRDSAFPIHDNAPSADLATAPASGERDEYNKRYKA